MLSATMTHFFLRLHLIKMLSASSTKLSATAPPTFLLFVAERKLVVSSTKLRVEFSRDKVLVPLLPTRWLHSGIASSTLLASPQKKNLSSDLTEPYVSSRKIVLATIFRIYLHSISASSADHVQPQGMSQKTFPFSSARPRRGGHQHQDHLGLRSPNDRG